MFEKIYKKYCDFLDVHHKNTTLLVLGIAFLVTSMGTFASGDISPSYLGANVIESQKIHQSNNIVLIEGIAYEVSFQKID